MLLSLVCFALSFLEFPIPHGKLNGPSRLPLCSWTRPWIQFSFAGVFAIFGLQLWRRQDICYAPPLINFKNINFCQTILASKCSDKLRLSWLNSAKNSNLYKKLNQSGTSENCCEISQVTASGLQIARMIDRQVFAFRLYPKRFQDLKVPKAYCNVHY